MKKIVFILIMILFIPNVYAEKLCEESVEHQNWNKLPIQEKKRYEEPSYCKKTTKVKKQIKRYIDLKGLNETYYSSVDLNLVTPPKNQGNTNACWAFAGVSLLETAAIMDGYDAFDFSERHINILSTYDAYLNNEKNIFGYNRGLNDGGNYSYVSSYFYRGNGPIFESSFPYLKSWYLNYQRLNKSDMPQDKPIITIDEYMSDYQEDFCSEERLSQVKKYVREYGSVGATINSSSGVSSGNDFYYINTTNPYTDHAVTIVGYDDSIKKENFEGATRDGAFIVKNSWGSVWGNNGYYYISYDDIRICRNVVGIKGVEPYYYDFVYNSSSVLSNQAIYNDQEMYVSTKLNIHENEYLDKVSIEAFKDVNYEVYLSKDNDLTNSSSWILLGKGISSTDGVTSIKFNKILLEQSASIIVKFIKNGYSVPLMCKSTDSNDKFYYMEIEDNKNYYSRDGITWLDMKSISSGSFSSCASVIYAYTYKMNKNLGSIDNLYLSQSSEKVYINSDDYFNVDFKTTNIDYKKLIKVDIVKDGEYVTSDFNIVKDYIKQNYITVKLKTGTKSGNYKITLSYKGSSKSINFDVFDKISSSVFKITGDYIKILPKKDIVITGNYVKDNITHENDINIKRDNLEITDQKVLPNDKLITNDKVYTIILIGDANMDGKISPLDYVRIKNHILGTKIMSDEINLLCADANEDGKITPLDYVRIKNRILKGEV